MEGEESSRGDCKRSVNGDYVGPVLAQARAPG